MKQFAHEPEKRVGIHYFANWYFAKHITSRLGSKWLLMSIVMECINHWWFAKHTEGRKYVVCVSGLPLAINDRIICIGNEKSLTKGAKTNEEEIMQT